ncbi:MAG: tetratricopeptide repeat protein, partial [Candidatus Limnocylindria bacterium]|nr:tetratricopeptide repeat protein [Candidatus Limnocylindria bacterium]
VDRFERETALDVRPVFLVAMPEASGDAGYLVFGSSPEPDLAAQYAASLGATHALSATYREEKDGRALDLALVDATTGAVQAKRSLDIAPEGLQRAEPELAAWLVAALNVTPSSDLATPAAANEAAYSALLEAMDEEVNATLLRTSDAARADGSLHAALERYVEAARADPTCEAAEERLLVLAAESLERRDFAYEVRSLEELISARPRSWRAHYILGQLRAEAGDANGAIVAFEHAHSLRPLPDADVVRLAELYANAGAPAPALAHLRRIAADSVSFGAAQELLAIISFQRGDEVAGRDAFARAVAAGTTSWQLHASHGAAVHARGALDVAAGHYRDALDAGAPSVVRLNLARVLLAMGDRDGATTELDALLAHERIGEVAGHAHRLRFGLREPALEGELERAGQAALAGETSALDGARSVFDRALAIAPDLWEAHFGLGIVARQRGDAAVAQQAFRRVLELWPDQPDALHELGVALLMGNEATQALGALDRAASLRPDDPAYLADAGFAHLRAGDLASARQRLERAAKLHPNDPITKSYLGELGRIEAEAGKRS